MRKFGRLAAGLLLLVALFYFRLIDLDQLRAALAHPGMLAMAAAACLATIPLAGLRWHVLLRSQRLALHLGKTIRIVAMGAFFGNFLPGSAGGDLVRGVYIYQEAYGQRTGALLSIFIDRLIGLLAFVVVAVVATLLLSSANYGVVEQSMFVLAGLFIAGLVALFLFGHHIARLVSRLFGGRSRRWAEIIDDVGMALHQYSRQWRSVCLSIVISIAVVMLIAFAIITIAAAMQFGRLTPLEYGVAGVYALIANGLPFTPGGLGIGEGAFASACVMFDPAAAGLPYGSIFLMFRCIIVISTLPGLVVYLVYPPVDRRRMFKPIGDVRSS